MPARDAVLAESRTSAMSRYQNFIGKLVNGGCVDASPVEFDALLHWLAGRKNRDAELIDMAFRNVGVSPKTAKARTLRYLDNNLFCHGNDYYGLFGLQPASSIDVVRARHKQMMQIFHPDRHPDESAWFTKRAEQLNQAYRQLQKQHRLRKREDREAAEWAESGRSNQSARGPVAPLNRGRTRGTNKDRFRQQLKAKLGDARRFERRLYVILFSILALVVLIVYLNRLESERGPGASARTGEAGSGTASRIRNVAIAQGIWQAKPSELGFGADRRGPGSLMPPLGSHDVAGLAARQTC